MAIDLDDYESWLRARGVADEHLPLYREGADAIARQMRPDEAWVSQDAIEAAVGIEAAMGASERRQNNLRAIGARLQAYVEERATPPPSYEPPPDDEPALELADVPRGHSRRARLARTSQQQAAVDGDGRVRGTMIDDLAAPEAAGPAEAPAAMPPRAALAPAEAPRGTRPSSPGVPVPFTEGPRPGRLASQAQPQRVKLDAPPLPGCVCRARHDLYPDDLWSMWGKVYLFAASTIGLALAIFWTRAASLAVGLAILAVGGLVTALTAGWKCDDCRRWIEVRALDEDQRADLRKRRLVFLAISVAASVGFLLAIKSLRADLARDREARKVLQDLRELSTDGD